jgi:oligopeptidase B
MTPDHVQAIGKPPVADQRRTVTKIHGVELVDEYAWLRDRDDPAVTAHLEAENAYTDLQMAHTTALQEQLYEEISARIQQTDESVPARRGDWWYVVRTYEGRQYPVFCRREGGPDGPESIMIDQNALADGHAYFALGMLDISADNHLLAYSSDTNGSEQYTMRIRDLESGDELGDVIENVYYGSAWSADSQVIFYTRQDEAMRPYQVWRHLLGTDPSEDECILQEDDDHFALHLGSTKSREWVVASLDSKTSSEIHVLPAASPLEPFRVVRPRREGVEYHLEHLGDRFIVLTNDGGAEDFKLVDAPITQPDQWRTIVDHRPGVRLEDLEVFATHLVLTERAGGARRLAIHDMSGTFERVLELPEAVGIPAVAENYEIDSATLRFNYTSLVTPPSVFDEDLASQTRVLLKTQPVHGYDADQFETRRLWATAADGVQIPISLVAQRGVPLDGSNPALLYGYGSYEHSIDPEFGALRVSLLERGFVFAIAHIRGGGEMGRSWYEDGKFFNKRNTFTDFIACAEHLVQEGWTSPQRLVIRGGSAGGLLMGAVLNLRPDLFRAAVADVPFVDVVNTMLDETLPLTAGEWEEWGDPRQADYFEYMRSYSPYDNVEAKDYPQLLVTAGLNDPRVAYWEPAKWVARLRERKTDNNLLLLQTEMGAGHSGPSGRYNAWRKEAFRMAFILDAVGIA